MAKQGNKKFCDQNGKKKDKKKEKQKSPKMSRRIIWAVSQSWGGGRRLPQEAISFVGPVANKTLGLQANQSGQGDPQYFVWLHVYQLNR